MPPNLTNLQATPGEFSCKQGTRETVGKELMVADARLSCFSSKCPRYRKVSLQSANVSSPQG